MLFPDGIVFIVLIIVFAAAIAKTSATRTPATGIATAKQCGIIDGSGVGKEHNPRFGSRSRVRHVALGTTCQRRQEFVFFRYRDVKANTNDAHHAPSVY
mmetsp:Transcript_23164/g.47945  ORF Transcript_23164/g.47945 Transcript_23164/m.47945 type:complete len:99 (-) Transcript_23164:832-1128(-)